MAGTEAVKVPTGSGLGDITGALGDIFGSTGSTLTEGTQKGKTKTTEQLLVDEEAINKLVADMLSGTGGLADIFSEENVAGVFGSSVGAQASGDLLSKVAGEIAKLTSVKEVKGESDVTTTEKETTEDGGLIGAIGGLF
jgi:hypothetical protein